jgi:hypothetical protein
MSGAAYCHKFLGYMDLDEHYFVFEELEYEGS